MIKPDRGYLLEVARDSWRLFERYVGEDTHCLPPDNIHRRRHTSWWRIAPLPPTSPFSSFFFLRAPFRMDRHRTEMLERCERTLETLAPLHRHRGHFLNWYDTSTLRDAPPAYVSTVDSGNMCGRFIARAWRVLRACWKRAKTNPRERASFIQAATCYRLAVEPDFAFLFDARRRLFHIGLRVDEHQLDKSFYERPVRVGIAARRNTGRSRRAT